MLSGRKDWRLSFYSSFLYVLRLPIMLTQLQLKTGSPIYSGCLFTLLFQNHHSFDWQQTQLLSFDGYIKNNFRAAQLINRKQLDSAVTYPINSLLSLFCNCLYSL